MDPIIPNKKELNNLLDLQFKEFNTEKRFQKELKR